VCYVLRASEPKKTKKIWHRCLCVQKPRSLQKCKNEDLGREKKKERDKFPKISSKNHSGSHVWESKLSIEFLFI